MEKQTKRKFKRWFDAIVKVVTCLAFFIVLGVEGKTFGTTCLIKGIGTIIVLVNMYLIDEYGRI